MGASLGVCEFSDVWEVLEMDPRPAERGEGAMIIEGKKGETFYFALRVPLPFLLSLFFIRSVIHSFVQLFFASPSPSASPPLLNLRGAM